MTTISLIRHFVSRLPLGEMFATRQVLNYGYRGSVDKALQALVKEGFIYRLANGVFARYLGEPKFPKVSEIAEFKAKVFGKKIRIHGVDTAAEKKLGLKANKNPTYYVDGSSSSFKFFGGRIFFKKACEKKMYLPDSRAGLAIRALWELTEDVLDCWHLDRIAHMWLGSREEIRTIANSKAWMPAWLGDFLLEHTRIGLGDMPKDRR